MIDTSALPTPHVFDRPDFETILAELVAFIKQKVPNYAPLESDQCMLILEAFAYRELHLLQRENNQIKRLLLPYATLSDLDGLAVHYGVTRLDGEQDEPFRVRILQSLDGHSTAGSYESYEYHARTVDARIDDAKAVSPAAGEVIVYITSFTEEISTDLIEVTELYLNADKIRPITDKVSVKAAIVKPVAITAQLALFNPNDKDSITAQVHRDINTLFRIGESLPLSQIIRQCHVGGVYKVTVETPQDDIFCAAGEIIHVADIHLTFSTANLTHEQRLEGDAQ